MSEDSVGIWIVLGVAVAAMLAVDLVLFGRAGRPIALRTAAIWSVVWTVIGVGFAGVVAWLRGGQAAEEYLAGFVIEKSLSVDNLFVFALIFGTFAVPVALQRRAIFWGIVGAIVLRGVFIAAGAVLLDAFHWMVYVFGAFLVATAVRMVRHSHVEIDPERNRALRALRRVVPISSEYHGERFLVRIDGARVATPLLAVLVLIAAFDVVFAVDSIPAIFAVTDDTFVVYAANAMSLLGLTALYFALAGMLERFRYLSLGLAVILGFVGTKMLVSGIVKVPVLASLAVILGVLAVAIGASLWRSGGMVDADEGERHVRRGDHAGAGSDAGRRHDADAPAEDVAR